MSSLSQVLTTFRWIPKERSAAEAADIDEVEKGLETAPLLNDIVVKDVKELEP
jgi:hypothetical protein